MDLIAKLAEELKLKEADVEAAVKLIDEGNTIPFIARYRKEATGGMDDVALRALDERLSYLRNLEERKEDVILLIDAQGKLTPELEQQCILGADKHPSAYIDVNGPAQMFDEFYETYDVQEGDGMYLASDARIVMW